MQKTVKIKSGQTSAEINLGNGQMFSLARDGLDVMWKGGAPDCMKPVHGWKNSEFVMFPIVGGAPNDEVLINGEFFPMGKHGLSRDLPWSVLNVSANSIKMMQSYVEGTAVANKDEIFSSFPYTFNLIKSYTIDNKGALLFRLEIESGSYNMPYADGWHPGFQSGRGLRIKMSDHGILKTVLSLEDVEKSKGNAVLMANTDVVDFKNEGFNMHLSHNFGHTMLWNRGEGYLAIEPVTSVPLSILSQNNADLDLASLASYRRLKRGGKDVLEAKIEVETC